MSKNLFETYEVNGRQYTDNLPKNALISIPKKQYIEYEQQREEIERLNKKYNKALMLLADMNMACDMVNCRIPDEYCEENCEDNDEVYIKCWDKYIELELKEK